LDRLRQAHQTWKDVAEFFFVYITDAPHEDPEGRSLKGESPGQRRERVRRESPWRVPFPCLLNEGRVVETAYDAFPQRLVLVGPDGSILLDTGHGIPYGWDLDELDERLETLVAEGP
jgi:hypothetical protein